MLGSIWGENEEEMKGVRWFSWAEEEKCWLCLDFAGAQEEEDGVVASVLALREKRRGCMSSGKGFTWRGKSEGARLLCVCSREVRESPGMEGSAAHPHVQGGRSGVAQFSTYRKRRWFGWAFHVEGSECAALGEREVMECGVRWKRRVRV